MKTQQYLVVLDHTADLQFLYPIGQWNQLSY